MSSTLSADAPVRAVPSLARGVLAALLLALNTLVWVPLLLLLACPKLLLRWAAAQRALARALPWVAESWIGGNSGWMRLTQRTAWDVDGLDGLDRARWYLVTCNHQSWVDVLVLQHVLNRRVPLLRFFLKRELLWVPVMGLAWWALDFPFLRREGAAASGGARHGGGDLAAVRKACAKFALAPSSVTNFVEGTRYSDAKAAAQQSPYRHLLVPKVGGLALAIDALGAHCDALLDVTIVYPDGVPTFWQFLCGGLPRVVVRVDSVPLPRPSRGSDFSRDPRGRVELRRWLNALWQDKDRRIGALLAAAAQRGAVPPAAANAGTCPSRSRT